MSKKLPPGPPGYVTLEVKEIDLIASHPNMRQVRLWFKTTTGEKIELVADLSELNQVLLLLYHNPRGAALRLVEGGQQE